MRIVLLSLLIFIGVALTVIADIFLKKSAAQNAGYLFLGLICYACVAFPVVLAFRMTEFGKLFLIWEAVTVAAGIVIATTMFREAFTVQKLIAFILVIVALVLSYRH
jgi:multidrug transporter EmrE-like cation transporter